MIAGYGVQGKMAVKRRSGNDPGRRRHNRLPRDHVHVARLAALGYARTGAGPAARCFYRAGLGTDGHITGRPKTSIEFLWGGFVATSLADAAKLECEKVAGKVLFIKSLK